MDRLTNQEVDELMRKRKFLLMCTTGSGIRGYGYADIEKTPRITVEVLPERREFKFSYFPARSFCQVSTNWCSPITSKEHFKKVLRDIQKIAAIIENNLKEEE